MFSNPRVFLGVAMAASLGGAQSIWIPRAPQPSADRIQALACSPDRCVAGSLDGTLSQTSDGVRWTPVDGVPPNGYWSNIEWIHGKFFAVGLYQWGVSPDGVHWEFRELNMARQSWSLVGAAWTGREFVLVGQHDSAMVSRDGSTWEAVPFDCQVGRSLGSHTASGGGDVVIAFDHGAGCASSDSGRTWKEVVDSADQPFGGFHAVGWDGSRFLSLAQDQIWSSDDGLHWKLDLWGKYLYARAFYTDSAADLAWGRETTNGKPSLWRRPRGGRWSQVDTFETQVDVTEFGRGPFGYLVLGEPSHRLFSRDGLRWIPEGPDPDYFAVVHGLGRFHAVGGAGRAISSVDGISWSAGSTSTVRDLVSLATDGKRLVAVGDSGAILVSDDGASWKTVASGTTRILRSVAWNGRKFLAVGDSGTVLGSVDGSSWTPGATAPSGSLSRVVSADGAWYLMTSDGDLLTEGGSGWRATGPAARAAMVGAADGRGIVVQDRSGGNWWSKDGADWVRPTIYGSVSPVSVVHTGSEWIVVGNSLSSSSDGRNWQDLGGSLVGVQGMASSESLLVAVGKNGTIWTSARTASAGTRFRPTASSTGLQVRQVRGGLAVRSILPGSIELAVCDAGGRCILRRVVPATPGQESVVPLDFGGEARLVSVRQGRQRMVLRTLPRFP